MPLCINSSIDILFLCQERSFLVALKSRFKQLLIKKISLRKCIVTHIFYPTSCGLGFISLWFRVGEEKLMFEREKLKKIINGFGTEKNCMAGLQKY